ncbi:MAG: asparagine synthase (glutamine-hydrolyzing) [Endomicrobiia bacterium]
MCGITGIYSFNNKQVEFTLLKKMADVLLHRGPDEEGFYISKNFNIDEKKSIQVGLGIKRLAIIDLKTGSQPIHNEEKTVYVVCNGEIYNFINLREDLQKQGHVFYTKSDVEVLVHLYEEEGIGFLSKLRGMYAFAIWDEKNKKLYLVRDRVGKKPLYYTLHNGELIFGSEIKSILVYLNKQPEINFEAIDFFLTYQYIPQPITIFKNIYKLPPASYLVIDSSGSYDIKKYWQLDFRKKIKINFEEAKQKIRDILTEAVKLRLISDVPLGAFLSGGHDSSIIVGLMAESSSTKVRTFSVGFKEQDFSELKYARIVAKHFNTDHTEIIVEPKMVEILPKLVWHYDQPFADTSMIPSYYVANVARKHVKVALNGDGGDENFCGYLRYPAIKISSLFPFELVGKNFYEKLGNLIPLVETISATHKLRFFRRFFTALGNPIPVRNVLWHCFFTNELKDFIYSDFMKKIVKNNVYNYLVNTFYLANAYDTIDRISYTDITTYLPEDLLVKMDIASMANSLEARSPFLDYKLLEFTASIPSSWKLKFGFKTKYILKETFKNFLPKQILKRSKKGFGLPVSEWLKSSLKDYVKEILLSEKFRNRKLFNFRNIKFLIEQHFQNIQDHGNRIFALIVLEIWFRIFVEKEDML